MPEKVFTAQGLTKTYTSGEVEVHALRGVDLDISGGEVVVLLGPSGSGKSTLLNIMGGLDHASSGHLFFKDMELTALGDRALTTYRRQHVGFVFQFYNLMASLTAYENVALVTEIADHPMQAPLLPPSAPHSYARKASAGRHNSPIRFGHVLTRTPWPIRLASPST